MPATDERLIQVLGVLDQRLQGVEQWATPLEMVCDVPGLDRDLKKVKEVRTKSGIGIKGE